MAKHLALLSCIWLLVACNNGKHFGQRIKGDWFGQKEILGRPELYQTEFLSIDESTCRTNSWHDVLKYEISKNYLYVVSAKNEKEGPRRRFKIVKLTNDSLVLLTGKQLQHTVKYSRIQPKNNITPTAIYFASSGCFGTCPAMHLEIDSNRNIRFYGVMYTTITGGYTGKLSEKVYNTIIRKIRTLPVDSLKEFYSASYSDSRTLGIAIAHGNTITRSSSYGHEEEPMELYILFSQLVNLYKEVSLHPDSSISDYGFITHPQLKSVTGLLVPPIYPPKVED